MFAGHCCSTAHYDCYLTAAARTHTHTHHSVGVGNETSGGIWLAVSWEIASSALSASLRLPSEASEEKAMAGGWVSPTDEAELEALAALQDC